MQLELRTKLYKSINRNLFNIADPRNIFKMHHVIHPLIFDDTNQRQMLKSTRQTVNK